MDTTRKCVFCGGPAAGRRGEHVLPRWLLKRLDSAGPFVRSDGNGLLRKGDGTDRPQTERLSRAMLREVCGAGDRPGDNCNNWLEQHFEREGKRAVLKLFGPGPVLDGAETVAFARWALKTLLLLDHPLIENVGFDPAGMLPRSRPWYPDAGLRVLRDTGVFPADLSLWMVVGKPVAGTGQLTGGEVIEVAPAKANTAIHDYLVGLYTFMFRADVDRLIGLQFVSHAGGVVRNPFEEAGLAVRLWPSPPPGLDLHARPALSDAGIGQWRDLEVQTGLFEWSRPGRVGQPPA